MDVVVVKLSQAQTGASVDQHPRIQGFMRSPRSFDDFMVLQNSFTELPKCSRT